MSDFRIILRLIKSIDREAIKLDRHNRFKDLVTEHGVELVSVATGLTQATVKVYYSAKRNIPTIGLEPLMQAEEVFKQLKEKQ